MYVHGCKMDDQQGPTVEHKEHSSILCNNLNGKRIWKRIDVCIGITRGLPRWLGGWRIYLQCRRCRRHRLNPWKVPWKRAWQPTPVFLRGKSQGQRSPVGYGPWCPKELDTTEATTHACNHRCLSSFATLWVQIESAVSVKSTLDF